MHWFGQVDDSDGRWEMDVEKVVRQVGLGILRQYKIGFRPHSSIDFNFVHGWYLQSLQSDPISEDELMTKWNTAVLVGTLSNTPRNRETTSAHLRRFPPPTHYLSLVQNFQPTLPRDSRTSFSSANVGGQNTSSRIYYPSR